MNNIGLYLDEITKYPIEDRCKSLNNIGQRAAKNNDRYTFSRAYVRLGRISGIGVQDGNRGLANQITAYQYLYEERIEELFFIAHNNLWNYFRDKMEVTNLLRLFRHSSYIWRLNGKEEKEIPYIKELIEKLPQLLEKGEQGDSMEANYFIARAEKLQPLLGNDRSISP